MTARVAKRKQRWPRRCYSGDVLMTVAVTALLATSDMAALQAALSLEQGGDDRGSLAQLEALARQAPAWELPRLEAARLHLKLGQGIELAEWHADVARSLAPENPRAHFTYGLVCSELGRLAEAKRAYEVAVALRENYPDAQLKLAGVLFSEGAYLDAVKHFHAYVAERPSDVGAKLQLAAAMERAGQLDDATRELKALALVPQAQQLAYRRLAELFERRGNKPLAAQFRSKADPPKKELRSLKPSAR